MGCKCSVSGGDLVIVDISTGNTIWRGRFFGIPVWQALPVPGSDDCLVLLEYWARAGYGLRNLLRVTTTGQIVWQAEQPERDHDRYVEVRWADGDLVAWSFSDFRVRLDPTTGRILSSTFLK